MADIWSRGKLTVQLVVQRFGYYQRYVGSVRHTLCQRIYSTETRLMKLCDLPYSVYYNNDILCERRQLPVCRPRKKLLYSTVLSTAPRVNIGKDDQLLQYLLIEFGGHLGWPYTTSPFRQDTLVLCFFDDLDLFY